MTDLLALADRVEKLTGPDRELDEAIAKALGVPATLVVGHECLGNLRTVPQNARAYTSSLDAAMSLVPEGMQHLVRSHDPSDWRNSDDCYAHIGYQKGEAYAATPALALCAAALRALANRSAS